MNLNGQTTQQSFQSELRRHVVRASRMSSQTWCELGISDDLYPHAVASSSIEVTAECVTSLLLIRLVVLATPRNVFKDQSTSSICQTLLEPRCITSLVPVVITESVIQELRAFVLSMLRGYNNVPYHNYKHAYHVLLSSSTLMDLILQNSAPRKPGGISTDTSTPFEDDGLMQLALLFSALIHDTEHQGVPNAQLVNENHPLALQYNDQSVAEQRSLTVAFLELLQPAYDGLRGVMFPNPNSGEEYRRFRGAVTSLILATDISTPARGREVRERWESVFKSVTDVPPNANQDTTKTRSGLPVLPPPREHPTPSRRRRKLLASANGIVPSIGIQDTENSWIDCCPTPSTHFPRSTAGVSMHDSLAFWWFSPEQLTEDDDDDSSVKTFSEDDTNAAASLFNHDMTNLLDEVGKNDLDASISMFSELDRSALDESSAFSDDYPHESKAFQFSCSTLSDDSSHPLLTSSRVFRPRRSFSNKSSGGLSKGNRKGESSSEYCDMSASAGNDSISSKPRTIFDAFTACTPKRRARKAEILVDHIEATVNIGSSHVDSESSLLSGGLTADLTCTDVSSANNTPVPAGFNSSNTIEFSETNDTWEHESNNDDDEEVALKGEVEEEMPPKVEVIRAPDEAPDEKIRSLSLIEHILLVADVSHTMQSWDTMNMFALRLSKEIMKSIKKGRSGGMKDDPLDDWYSNQSAFLHGYILPLAKRLEQTGTLPPAEHSCSDGFLSSQIQKNLDRWQESGHDIIALWRREREKRSNKRALKRLKKKKNQKDAMETPTMPKNKKIPAEPKKSRRGKKHTKEPEHVQTERPSIPATNTRPFTLSSAEGGDLDGKVH